MTDVRNKYNEPLLVVGAGRLGLHLTRHLAEAGYSSLTLWNRRTLCGDKREWAACCTRMGVRLVEDQPLETLLSESPTLLLTLPDDVLLEIDRLLSPDTLRKDAVILHTSGARSSEVLSKLSGAKRCFGAVHPLQSLAGAPEDSTFEGIYFGVEGAGRALVQAEKIVAALKGKVVRIAPEKKVLYHGAAVLASNLTVALAALSARLMADAAGTPDDVGRGLDMLLPLIKGTVGNLERVGLPKALTGPVSRGDVETLRAHLQALKERALNEGADETLSAYRLLSRTALALAREQGLRGDADNALAALLAEPPPLQGKTPNE